MLNCLGNIFAFKGLSKNGSCLRRNIIKINNIFYTVLSCLLDQKRNNRINYAILTIDSNRRRLFSRFMIYLNEKLFIIRIVIGNIIYGLK